MAKTDTLRPDPVSAPILGGRFLLLASVLVLAGAGCKGKVEQPGPPPAQEAAVIRVVERDVPAVHEFVGQTESSRRVEVRARVSGFLDKIAYREGVMVRQGELMFVIDPKGTAEQMLISTHPKSDHAASTNLRGGCCKSPLGVSRSRGIRAHFPLFITQRPQLGPQAPTTICAQAPDWPGQIA
jgi:hypothetical protein